MLRSMLDWIADEDIRSETQFTDVMKQRRFHEAIRDRLSGLPQVSVASIFNKQGHLLSSSSDWPAPSIYIGERGELPGPGRPEQPADFDPPGPARLQHQALELLFVAQDQVRDDALLGVAVVGIESDYFQPVSPDLARRGQLGIAVPARWSTACDDAECARSMGEIYADAQPIGVIRNGLSGTAEITRRTEMVGALGCGKAHHLVAPGRSLSCARQRDDRRQDFSRPVAGASSISSLPWRRC